MAESIGASEFSMDPLAETLEWTNRPMPKGSLVEWSAKADPTPYH